MLVPSFLLALLGLFILVVTLRLDDPSGDLTPWIGLGAVCLGGGVLLIGLWFFFFRD
jgi:hypothetical protein